MGRIVTMAGAALLLAVAWTAASSEMTIRVTPVMSFEPTNLRVRVTALPNASNRLLRVVAESGSFSSMSDRQVFGAESPKVTTFEFRGVPAGDYDITAFMIGADGRPRAQSHDRATVISKGLDH